MISVSILSNENEHFRLRLQGKDKDGLWADVAVDSATGRSQVYGIHKGCFRLVVEDVIGEPYNSASVENANG